MTNHLRELGAAGQSAWLDYLHRQILENGELKRLIETDGVTGLTSNPSIFEKAIGEGDAYDARLKAALRNGVARPIDLFERLALPDIQDAADLFRPVHERTGGRDGFVSLEVSPRLAMDAKGTIDEARRLWRSVGRPNLMIKVPGTSEGAAAIRQLISEGVNVNVTLLFGVAAYMRVAEAHLAGLEDRRAAGASIAGVHSVASFFVSRIDTQIDGKIDAKSKDAPPEEAERLRRLRGKIAIANAKRAYQRYLRLVESERWLALARFGAAPQRLLWASTGVKDPAYPDTLYVDALIGPNTVDTMPPKTMDAFRDHGRVAATLLQGLDAAEAELAEAERLGLDLGGVTDALVVDGVKQFADAFDALLAAVEAKTKDMASAA
jgi:transaldolase/glucose-6-phosphate isomerase